MFVNQAHDENAEESRGELCLDFDGESGAAGGGQMTMDKVLGLVWNALESSHGWPYPPQTDRLVRRTAPAQIAFKNVGSRRSR